MYRMIKTRIIFLLLFILCGFQNINGQVSKLQNIIKYIDSNDYGNKEQYSFLSPIIRDVDIIMLGESIHLTREFPLVRIGMIKYLNQYHGFNVIAMEGGAADYWATQDILFSSEKNESDFTEALSAFPFIWNTPEVQKLIAYQASTLQSTNPLYITAYDVQQGIGQGMKNEKAFKILAERLMHYSDPPQNIILEDWVAAMSPISNHCIKYGSSDYQKVVSAIDLFEEWVNSAVPEVKKHYPNIPHDVILKTMPKSFRASLTLCEDLGGFNLSRYKVVRDSLGFINTLDLIQSIPNNKILIWGHLSHVYYDSQDNIISEMGEWKNIAVGPTVGERLKDALGSKVYTIIPFAESGSTILIYNDLNLDIGYSKIEDRSKLGTLLSKVSEKDFFIDLQSSALTAEDYPEFFKKQPFAIEGLEGDFYINYASDMDGLIWIKKIEAPGWPLFKILLLSSLHYKKQIAFLFIVGIGWLIFSRVKKRKNQK
jgi:erythromycin esterase-like protein|tara:strand:- start:2485 stop:3933 length:1449 start_codon:yes stop_codon:yes gene_type:complete